MKMIRIDCDIMYGSFIYLQFRLSFFYKLISNSLYNHNLALWSSSRYSQQIQLGYGGGVGGVRWGWGYPISKNLFRKYSRCCRQILEDLFTSLAHFSFFSSFSVRNLLANCFLPIQNPLPMPMSKTCEYKCWMDVVRWSNHYIKILLWWCMIMDDL